MAFTKELIAVLRQEIDSTRKILQRVPDGKNNWAPHEKSMKLGRLATHVAEITGWITVTVTAEVLDFAAGNSKPIVYETNEERMKFFEETSAKSIEILSNISDEELEKSWTMRNGDTVYFTVPKRMALRTWVFSHLVHHRAQPGVYLRLLKIPVPAIYGPSADESTM